MKQSKTEQSEILNTFLNQKMKKKIIINQTILERIRPYLKDIIHNLKKSDTWEIQVTITSNFMSSKDTDEER